MWLTMETMYSFRVVLGWRMRGNQPRVAQTLAQERQCSQQQISHYRSATAQPRREELALAGWQWNCSLLHFPLTQFYFPRASLGSYALCGHCPDSESSLWSILSQLWSPGLNLLPAPTLPPANCADRKIKQLTTGERNVGWQLNTVGRALKNAWQSKSRRRDHFHSTSGGVLCTTVILFFTVGRHGESLAMISKVPSTLGWYSRLHRASSIPWQERNLAGSSLRVRVDRS